MGNVIGLGDMMSELQKKVLLGLKKYTEHGGDEDRSQGQIIWKKNRNKETRV